MLLRVKELYRFDAHKLKAQLTERGERLILHKMKRERTPSAVWMHVADEVYEVHKSGEVRKTLKVS